LGDKAKGASNVSDSRNSDNEANKLNENIFKEVTLDTLDGLITYFGLPSDAMDVKNKLKNLKLEKHRGSSSNEPKRRNLDIFLLI